MLSSFKKSPVEQETIGCYSIFQVGSLSYVRENGDVELADMVNTEPFNNYDLNDMFGMNLQAIVQIVGVLHNSVVAVAA